MVNVRDAESTRWRAKNTRFLCNYISKYIYTKKRNRDKIMTNAIEMFDKKLIEKLAA